MKSKLEASHKLEASGKHLLPTELKRTRSAVVQSRNRSTCAALSRNRSAGLARGHARAHTGDVNSSTHHLSGSRSMHGLDDNAMVSGQKPMSARQYEDNLKELLCCSSSTSLGADHHSSGGEGGDVKDVRVGSSQHACRRSENSSSSMVKESRVGSSRVTRRHSDNGSNTGNTDIRISSSRGTTRTANQASLQRQHSGSNSSATPLLHSGSNSSNSSDGGAGVHVGSGKGHSRRRRSSGPHHPSHTVRGTEASESVQSYRSHQLQRSMSMPDAPKQVSQDSDEDYDYRPKVKLQARKSRSDASAWGSTNQKPPKHHSSHNSHKSSRSSHQHGTSEHESFSDEQSAPRSAGHMSARSHSLPNSGGADDWADMLQQNTLQSGNVRARADVLTATHHRARARAPPRVSSGYVRAKQGVPSAKARGTKPQPHQYHNPSTERRRTSSGSHGGLCRTFSEAGVYSRPALCTV